MAEEEKVVVEQQAEAQEAPAQEAQNTENKPNFRRNPRNDKRGPRNDRKFASKRPVKEFKETVVAINRVCKTVKGGRKMKFSALVVVGNGKGKYGFGMGKSNEVPEAIKKAVGVANKNINRIAIKKPDSTCTIPHEIVGQYGATKVFLKPAKDGTGIIAGGPVRSILELAGIKNVYSKVYGSRTPINIIRATDNAIRNLKTYTQVQELRK